MMPDEAARFSFFQLVQLLERHHNPRATVGCGGPASQEVIRFRPDDSLAFPTSDVASLEKTSENPPRYQLTTRFLGLYGSVSPLPIFYAEEILRSDADPNPVRDFLDVFHHRLISLFYRAWLKYRYHFQFSLSGEDAFSHCLFSLMGLGTPELLDGSGLLYIRLLRYAGLFHQKPHSASALGGMISDFFGQAPVRVQQCTGRWIQIRAEQRSSLGRKNSSLAADCAIGERVFNPGSGFRVSLGPLDYDSFVQFLPFQKNLEMLILLVKLFTLDRFDFSIELQVIELGIPRMVLSSTGPPKMGSRLGWTSWLITQNSKNFEDDRTRSLVLQGRLRSNQEKRNG